MIQIQYPFQIDGRGRTGVTDEEQHIRQLLEQLIFTAPGERVNRPTFGAGALRLIFAPNSPELATATEFLIQSAIQQHLGALIQPEAVRVVSQDASLTVTVQYLLRRTQQRQVVEFSREG